MHHQVRLHSWPKKAVCALKSGTNPDFWPRLVKNCAGAPKLGQERKNCPGLAKKGRLCPEIGHKPRFLARGGQNLRWCPEIRAGAKKLATAGQKRSLVPRNWAQTPISGQGRTKKNTGLLLSSHLRFSQTNALEVFQPAG
ncbi:MAG: hypothetical protein QM296_11410 [Bacillota bacterium]|nr:hypothetical protein [Bacillota bacterium]